MTQNTQIINLVLVVDICCLQSSSEDLEFMQQDSSTMYDDVP